jgi:hypothetical protein
MGSDDWSPDEALGTESFRQADVAEDEGERTGETTLEDLEQNPSLDPALMADDLEIEELGAQLDDPERMVTLQGGIDDPDGLDSPPGRLMPGDEGWDLDAPLVGGDDEGDVTSLDLG